MDPLSIISSAVSIYGFTSSLVQSISNFCTTARHVDIVVEDLKNDILTVDRAVRSIQQQAQEASQNQTNNQSDNVWLDARQALEDCSGTLQAISAELGAELGAVGLNSSSGVAGTVKRTVRLNIRKDEIQRLRGRIRWNQSTLQMVLETIIIKLIRGQGEQNDHSMQKLYVHIQKLAEDLQKFTESAPRYNPPDSSVRSYQHHARQVLDSARSEYEIWSNTSEISSHDQSQGTHHRVLNWQDTVHDDVSSTINAAYPANRDALRPDAEDGELGRSLSSVSTTSDARQWNTFIERSNVEAIVSSRLMRPSSICEEIFKRAEMWYAKGDYLKATRMYTDASIQLKRQTASMSTPEVDIKTLELCLAVSKLRTAPDRQNLASRVVTPHLEQDPANDSSLCPSHKLRRQLLLGDYFLLCSKYSEAEKYYLDVLENLTQELGNLSVYFRASASAAWLMASYLQGRLGEAEFLAENLDEYINYRLSAFAKRNNISLPTALNKAESSGTLEDTMAKALLDYKSLVKSAIEVRDIEVLFLALNQNKRFDVNWRKNQDLNAKDWFHTALLCRSPSIFRILFFFEINVNQIYEFYPKTILHSVPVNVLFIAIAGSASDKALETIALMCIDHNAQWTGVRGGRTWYGVNSRHMASSSYITALHLAAYVDNATIVEKLLARGANENATACIYGLRNRKLETGPTYLDEQVIVKQHTFREVAESRKAEKVLRLLGSKSKSDNNNRISIDKVSQMQRAVYWTGPKDKRRRILETPAASLGKVYGKISAKSVHFVPYSPPRRKT